MINEARLLQQFLELVKINDVFVDWQTAQKTHFDDGGTFDTIYK